MSFEERAARGDALGTLRIAAINGALWAIGTAWSNAVREVTRALLPDDTMDIVLAEVVAALITTVIGVGLALFVARKWCARTPEPPAPPPRRDVTTLARAVSRA